MRRVFARVSKDFLQSAALFMAILIAVAVLEYLAATTGQP